MQLFLALIKDNISIVPEVDEEDVFEFIGDFIKKASNISMQIVVVQDPSQPLINP